MQTHKTEKQSRHRQHSKGMAKQGTEKVNQTLSYPRNATQARYRKDRGDMPTFIGYSPTRDRKRKSSIVIPHECGLKLDTRKRKSNTWS